MSFFYVFIGGGLGSMVRYGISVLLENKNYEFPLATFLANSISCFVLGFLISWLLNHTHADHYKILLITGFCGGFSTFSTFTYETWQLIDSGNLTYAGLNILGSLIICIVFLLLGLAAGHSS